METLKERMDDIFKCNRIESRNYFSSILNEEIVEEEFVKDYCNLPGGKRSPSKGKSIYKNLIKYELIKSAK